MASRYKVGGVYLTADIDTKNFNKSAGAMEKTVSQKLTGAFKKLGVAVAVAFTVKAVADLTKKITGLAKETQKLYKVQEQAEIKLRKLMENAGVYTKENYEEMKKYAGELQKVSNYGDEYLMPIIADLSKAKLSTEQLKQATKAYVDMMASGADAGMLSKALEKPVEMAGMLRRQGILISQEELKTLKLEEQRAKILDAIKDKYGGMAEELVDPTKQIQNAIGDLKELFGAKIDKAWKSLAPDILNTIYEVQTRIQPMLNTLGVLLQNMVVAAKNFGKLINPVLSYAWEIFQGILAGIAKITSDKKSIKNAPGFTADKASLVEYSTNIKNEKGKYSSEERATVIQDIKDLKAQNEVLKDYFKALSDEAEKYLSARQKDIPKATDSEYWEKNGTRLAMYKDLTADDILEMLINGTSRNNRISRNSLRTKANQELGRAPTNNKVNPIVLKAVKEEEDALIEILKNTFQKFGDRFAEQGLWTDASVFQSFGDNIDEIKKNFGETSDYLSKEFANIQSELVATAQQEEAALDKFVPNVSTVIEKVQTAVEDTAETFGNKWTEVIDGLQGKLGDLSSQIMSVAGNGFNSWNGVLPGSNSNALFKKLTQQIKDTVDDLKDKAEKQNNDYYKQIQKTNAEIRKLESQENLTAEENARKEKLKQFAQSLQQARQDAQDAIDQAINDTEATLAAAEAERTQQIRDFLISQAVSAIDVMASDMAEYNSEYAEEIREGADIVSSSLSNFAQGLSETGNVWGGLINMFIGWIMEIIERVGHYFVSMEASFIGISKLFDSIAELLAPIIAIIEYISAPLSLLLQLVAGLLDAISPLLTWVQVIMKPLKMLFDMINDFTSWLKSIIAPLGYYEEEETNPTEKYDKIIEQLNEIIDQKKKESDLYSRLVAAFQKITEDIDACMEYFDTLTQTKYSKATVEQIYKSTLKEIEDNRWFKDTSVNLNDYKALIAENGEIDKNLGQDLLMRLQYSELDASDFYVGTGAKLQKLIQELMNYQSKEDNTSEKIQNKLADLEKQGKNLETLEDELIRLVGRNEAGSVIKNIEQVGTYISEFTGAYNNYLAEVDRVIEESIKGITVEGPTVNTSISVNVPKNSLGTLETGLATANTNLASVSGGISGMNKNLSTMTAILSKSAEDAKKAAEDAKKAAREEYERAIREQVEAQRKATAEQRRSELADILHKKASDRLGNMVWYDIYRNDGFSFGEYDRVINSYINGLTDDQLNDASVYSKLKKASRDFSVGSSEHSYWTGDSAGKNGRTWGNRAVNSLKSAISGTKAETTQQAVDKAVAQKLPDSNSLKLTSLPVCLDLSDTSLVWDGNLGGLQVWDGTIPTLDKSIGITSGGTTNLTINCDINTDNPVGFVRDLNSKLINYGYQIELKKT